MIAVDRVATTIAQVSAVVRAPAHRVLPKRDADLSTVSVPVAKVSLAEDAKNALWVIMAIRFVDRVIVI